MKIPDSVKCKVCKRIFCCAKCRYKHEIKYHAIVVHRPQVTAAAAASTTTTTTMPSVCDINQGDRSRSHSSNSNDGSDNETTSRESIYLFCPICEQKPLVLQEDMFDEMLEHIGGMHLPLHCLNCDKLYNRIDDLKEFSKCIIASVSCNVQSSQVRTCDTDAIVTKAPAQATISTQTSPMLRRLTDYNDSQLTPISIINIRWKAKTKIAQDEFISSDSASSLKNISSINNSCSMRRSIGVTASSTVKGKLVRSTSTPVNTELLCAQPKEQIFNATVGQVSSIQYSSYESDNSSPLHNSSRNPTKQPVDTVNRHIQVGGRAKITAVTPLRHVMSKSIQKAIAEHAQAMPSTSACDAGLNHKKIFDAAEKSSFASSPLDLRLSPAIRRTQNEICKSANFYHAEASACKIDSNKIAKLRREILLSSKKLTTESIVITRTSVESSATFNTTTGSYEFDSNKSNSPTSNVNSNQQLMSSATSSVYKSCHCVEIYTATEFNEVNMTEDSHNANEQESSDELCPLQTRAQDCGASNAVGGYNLAANTPITRIPGTFINKKYIKFETPYMEKERETHSITADSSRAELFFTPNATPERKSSYHYELAKYKYDDEECENVAQRYEYLNGHFGPTKRRAIRELAPSVDHNRIDYVKETYDDEVFTPDVTSTQEEKPTDTDQAPSSGRLWSLVSTVMRFPALIGGAQKKFNAYETEKKSLITRCASIAGSLVRSKSLADEDSLKPLKRKRTYTIDSQPSYTSKMSCNDPISPNAESSLVSSKRYRIQGRKPIERMRKNSC